MAGLETLRLSVGGVAQERTAECGWFTLSSGTGAVVNPRLHASSVRIGKLLVRLRSIRRMPIVDIAIPRSIA